MTLAKRRKVVYKLLKCFYEIFIAIFLSLNVLKNRFFFVNFTLSGVTNPVNIFTFFCFKMETHKYEVDIIANIGQCLISMVIGWPRLLKRWITLSTGQITIRWIAQLVLLVFIHWMVIYPVDRAIHRLNRDRGLDNLWTTDK